MGSGRLRRRKDGSGGTSGASPATPATAPGLGNAAALQLLALSGGRAPGGGVLGQAAASGMQRQNPDEVSGVLEPIVYRHDLPEGVGGGRGDTMQRQNPDEVSGVLEPIVFRHDLPEGAGTGASPWADFLRRR